MSTICALTFIKCHIVIYRGGHAGLPHSETLLAVVTTVIAEKLLSPLVQERA
jgi:hypothetical protein